MMPTRRVYVATVCILGAAVLALSQSGAAGALSSHHFATPSSHRTGTRGAATRRLAPRALLSQACPDANSTVSGAPAAALRTAVLCLMNQARNARGLPSLRASSRLTGVAQRWTHAMIASGSFDHGADFALRISSGGYAWRAAAENIASGYATPLSVVNAWMNSQGHCRNILNPAFRDVGTGVAVPGVGGATGPGTWTADFGLRMSQAPASSDTRPQNGCPY